MTAGATRIRLDVHLHRPPRGAVGRNLLGEGPDQQELPGEGHWHLATGKIITVVTLSGGGWGGRLTAPGSLGTVC